MIVFLAKDFNNRQELEAKVSSVMGLTTDPKLEYSVSGTRAELRKLFLGHGKIFWGIPVVETDFIPSLARVEVTRGEIYKSKLEEVDINAYDEEPPKKLKGRIKKLKGRIKKRKNV